jgi:hypothetical protein
LRDAASEAAVINGLMMMIKGMGMTMGTMMMMTRIMKTTVMQVAQRPSPTDFRLEKAFPNPFNPSTTPRG